MRRDLVEAASRGDHEAFDVLAASAGDRLYAVALLILRAPDLAEDAVQEALVRAWKQLPSLRDPDKFDAWLYRLVVNACAEQGRQLRRWSQQVRALPTEHPSAITRLPLPPRPVGAGLRSTQARAAGGRRPPLLQRVLGIRNRANPRHPRGNGEIPTSLRDRGDACGARSRCASARGRIGQDERHGH